MPQEYDIIVAGAGISGALAAAAAAKGGAKVLMLDRNKLEEPGKKTNWGWVCGDAVAKSHIDYINKMLDTKIPDSVLDHKVDGVFAISPDLQKKFLFEGEGYSLNRPAFGKFLVELAVKSGAEYRTGYGIDGPILDGEIVKGVYGRDDRQQPFRIEGRLVIDALGISSMLRRKLPANKYVDREISLDDVETTGRYIADFDLVKDDLAYYDRNAALIHLNQELAPGGYGWVFPRADNKINIGLGVEKKSLELRNSKMGKKDTLHTLIDAYISWNPAIGNLKLYNDMNNGKGYWSVPVRRQLDSLVYHNYIGAGDSMAMPNPISAGGIGPAMVGGYLAGEAAAECIRENDTSMESLWRYNLRYTEAYGLKTAGLEAFRVYLQSLNNNLINYGMHHFLTDKEAEQISYGIIPELTLANTFKKVLAGVANINAFSNLVYVVKKMKALNELYSKYPKSPKEFDAWKGAVAKEMSEVKERFHPNPV